MPYQQDNINQYKCETFIKIIKIRKENLSLHTKFCYNKVYNFVARQMWAGSVK